LGPLDPGGPWYLSSPVQWVLRHWWRWWYGGRIHTRLLLTQFKEFNLRIRRSRRRK